MNGSTIRRFLQASRARIADDGLDGATAVANDVYRSVLRHGVSRVYWPTGTPIFEEEWDLLVILDACRADLVPHVRDDYDFLDAPGTRFSVDSTSRGWLEENFADRYATDVADTAYVTGNPYSDAVLDAADFELLDEVWKYAWDDDLGTIQPRPLTDRAITVHRELAPDRLVVHYMQPHYPFVRHRAVDDGIPLGYFREDLSSDTARVNDVWDKFRAGELSVTDVRDLYVDNLRYVLDDVRVLLDNVTADVAVISADHGNAFGEYGLYGHPAGMPFRPLREVPWYVTEAEDTRSHEPRDDYREETDEQEVVDDRLRDLGYL